MARGRSLPATYTWLLAGAGNAGGLITFHRATELGPPSLVAPLGALGAVIPAIWGLTSGESSSAVQILGLALAPGGAVLTARRPPANVPAVTEVPLPHIDSIVYYYHE